jgi:hypothetical protein
MMTRPNKLNPISLSLLKGIKSSILIVKAVIPLLIGERNEQLTVLSCYQNYCDQLIKEINNRGPKFAVTRFKQYKRIGESLALGINFDPLPWTKSNKRGIPKVLVPLAYLLEGTCNQKRIGLTILNTVRLLHLQPILDLEAITAPGNPVRAEFRSEFETFLKGLEFLPGNKYTIEQRSLSSSGFFSSKMGPNGPAVIYSHLDALALSRSESVYWAVIRMLKVSNPDLARLLDTMIQKMSPIKDSPAILSKISMISEGAGKTRNIAILDFFSQNALKPIHDIVMSVLKTIDGDSTYSQEDGFRRGMRLAQLSGYCASFDLSSATDRFPLSLQVDVVTQLFGRLVGKDWCSVISDRDFYEPSTKKSGIRWSVGQPLGALSSWGVFTLAHHSIVRFCAGDPNFTNYQILGDDVMIFDKRVSEKYQEVMEKELSVKINLSKSFIATHAPVFGEFAKRIFLKDKELSGISPDLLVQCSKTIYMIPELLRVIRERWEITIPGAELYAPESFSHLSVKGRFHLSIFLGFKQALGALSGYPWCLLGIDAEKVKELYLNQLLTRLDKQVQSIWSDKLSYREKLFNKVIDQIKVESGGLASELVSNCVKQRHHPIYYAANHFLEGFYAQQDEILNIKDGLVEIKNIEKRFVIDPSLKPIFLNRKVQIEKLQGGLSLELYYSLLSKSKTANSLSK